MQGEKGISEESQNSQDAASSGENQSLERRHKVDISFLVEKDKRAREEDTDKEEREAKRNKGQTSKEAQEKTEREDSKKESEMKRKAEQEKVASEIRRREQAAEKKRLEEEAERAKEAKKKEMERRKKKEEMERLDRQMEIVREVDPIAEQFKMIQDNLNIIIEAVSRESSGKISVTRADQQSAKQSVMEVQQHIITFLVGHVVCLKEKGELKEQVRMLEQRITSLEGQKGVIRKDKEAEEERMPRRTGRESDEKMINNGKNERENERGRSYADVSKGSKDRTSGEMIKDQGQKLYS